MTSFKDCQRSPVQYLFSSQQQGNSGTHFPREVVLSSGRKYRYNYDAHGDLKKVTLPLGNTLAFSTQPGTKGLNRVTSKLPGLATPAVTYHTRDGLLAGRRQGNSITYVARFDGKGRPTSAASGDFVSQWHYRKAGLDTNSIFLCFLFVKNDPSLGKHFSLPLLQATPSSLSRTLEGPLELTQRPSRALDLPHALLSDYREIRTS